MQRPKLRRRLRVPGGSIAPPPLRSGGGPAGTHPGIRGARVHDDATAAAAAAPHAVPRAHRPAGAAAESLDHRTRTERVRVDGRQVIQELGRVSRAHVRKAQNAEGRNGEPDGESGRAGLVGQGWR